MSEWTIKQIGTEGWYEISHPRLPVVVEVRETEKIDAEEWGENANGLDMVVARTAGFVLDALNRRRARVAP